ncbi:MAG: hypothetical protein WB685_06010 [Pseudolabrys sp.]
MIDRAAAAGFANNFRRFQGLKATPFDNRDGLFCVKDSGLTGFKPVACEHFLRSLRWYGHKQFMD